MQEKKQKLKALFSVLLIFCMVINIVSPAFAWESDNITVTIEKFILGQGYLIEPTIMSIDGEDSGSTIVNQILKDANSQKTLEYANIQENGTYIWRYMINNDFIDNLSTYTPEDGDILRVQLCLSTDVTKLDEDKLANKDVLISVVALLNSKEDKDELMSVYGLQQSYDNAYVALSDIAISQSEIDIVLENLNRALADAEEQKTDMEEENTKADEGAIVAQTGLVDVGASIASTIVAPISISNSDIKVLNPTVDYAIQASANYRLNLFSQSGGEPKLGTGNGDWTILCLARSGLGNQEVYDVYYQNVVKEIKEKDCSLDNGVTYTEYSRAILALTSIGKDVTNVGGYDLLAKLTDLKNVKKQGINGPIWALIALDSHNYPIYDDASAKDQNSREKMVKYILEREITDANGQIGGWALGGDQPDPDITAMALYALDNYQDMPEVKAAIDRGVTVLSGLQRSGGGYDSWGSVNSESIAQVVLALLDLGIDIENDPRFIKGDGNWLLSSIMEHYIDDGTKVGFMHVKPGENTGGGASAGSWDGMATDQSMEALISYQRVKQGKSTIFNMNDITIDKGVTLESIQMNKNNGVYRSGDTVDLSVTYTPENTTEDKSVTWESNNPLVATVDTNGRVTILSGDYGSATITANVNGKIAAFTLLRNVDQNSVEMIINGIEGVTNQEQVNEVVLATKAYNDLLADNMDISTSHKAILQKWQDESKKINWNDVLINSGNSTHVSILDGVDWFIKMNSQDVKITTQEKIDKALVEDPDDKLLQLADIQFTNLMADNPNGEYKPSNKVKISMEIPSQTDIQYDHYRIVHWNESTEKLEWINGVMQEDGKNMVFEADSFSPFGIVAKKYIAPGTLLSIQVATKPSKLYYLAGSPLDVTGGKVRKSIAENIVQVVDMTLDMISGYNPNLVNGQILTVTVNDPITGAPISTYFSIQVISRLSVDYLIGEINKLDLNNLSIEQRDYIQGLHELYKELSTVEQEGVTNIDILNSAIEKINSQIIKDDVIESSSSSNGVTKNVSTKGAVKTGVGAPKNVKVTTDTIKIGTSKIKMVEPSQPEEKAPIMTTKNITQQDKPLMEKFVALATKYMVPIFIGGSILLVSFITAAVIVIRKKMRLKLPQA